MWGYISTIPPYVAMAWCLVEYEQDTFTFTLILHVGLVTCLKFRWYSSVPSEQIPGYDLDYATTFLPNPFQPICHPTVRRHII
jgi:hypothetical protein